MLAKSTHCGRTKIISCVTERGIKREKSRGQVRCQTSSEWPKIKEAAKKRNKKRRGTRKSDKKHTKTKADKIREHKQKGWLQTLEEKQRKTNNLYKGAAEVCEQVVKAARAAKDRS